MANIHDRLRKALGSHVIVLDTCFAMQASFDEFLETHKTVLKRNRILVPYRVCQELHRIIDRHDDTEYAAAYALQLIETGIEEGWAEYRRDPQDDKVINDAVISRVVEGVLPHRDMLVLTHDRNLTQYLRSKTQQQAFRVKDLVVAGVNAKGELFAWGDGNTTARRALRPRGNVASGPAPFSLTTKLAPSLGNPLSPRQTVREGDVLLLKDGSRIKLSRVLASGGEGTIYELDNQSSLCKVYHQTKLTVDRQEKIELMLTRKVSDPMICWPREAVYDSDKVFRGFIMPRADGQPVPLGHSLFIPAVFLKSHPSWTRRESAQLAVTILRKIKYLHDMGVLIGDINPLNILMRDEKTAFFVDCDSYQIEGYPCPVGTVNFTAPEIQGSDFRHFLRTENHEFFSVATLLFMIFMPGKSPYSHQGGGDGAANIQKMHFPYALAERASDAAPEGPWRLCWSHLSYRIKEAFDQSFHEDHRGKQRITVERWLSLLEEYARLLSKPDFVFLGPQEKTGFDLAILPENFRRVMKDGEVKPSWLGGGLTDRERTVRRLVSDAIATRRTSSPASAGFQGSQSIVRTQRRTAPARSQQGQSARVPVSTSASSLPAPTRKPLSADVVWMTAIAAIAAVGGIAALLWYYWGTSTGLLLSLGVVVASAAGAWTMITYRWASALFRVTSIGLIAGGVAVLGLLIWQYWSPIIEFLKMLVAIAIAIVVAYAIIAALSKK